MNRKPEESLEQVAVRSRERARLRAIRHALHMVPHGVIADALDAWLALRTDEERARVARALKAERGTRAA